MATSYFDPLSFRDIAVLFGKNTSVVRIDNYYRGGLIVPNIASMNLIPTQGAISVSNFYNNTGRVQVTITITSNTYNVNVYSLRSSAYVAGFTDIIVIINSGVVVGSTSYVTPSFTVPATFSSADSVSIVNNGTIVGAGGAGGDGNSTTVGSVGGTALSVARPITMFNLNRIAGGGGGGGGGAVNVPFKGDNTAGGGGGGGAGFNGGAGGGGNGGGANGTLTAGGAGGSNGIGGTGGTGGAQGATGGKGGDTGGGGGSQTGATGGLGGFYVVGNSNVTWSVSGTLVGRAG